jgi:hypothetical protein
MEAVAALTVLGSHRRLRGGEWWPEQQEPVQLLMGRDTQYQQRVHHIQQQMPGQLQAARRESQHTR